MGLDVVAVDVDEHVGEVGVDGVEGVDAVLFGLGLLELLLALEGRGVSGKGLLLLLLSGRFDVGRELEL